MKSYIYTTATETAHALIKYLIDMMKQEFFILLSAEELLLQLCLIFGRMSIKNKLHGNGCVSIG